MQQANIKNIITHINICTIDGYDDGVLQWRAATRIIGYAQQKIFSQFVNSNFSINFLQVLIIFKHYLQ